jgi:hypothetical protein
MRDLQDPKVRTAAAVVAIDYARRASTDLLGGQVSGTGQGASRLYEGSSTKR